MVAMLGRRIERLLYVGFLLIALCMLEAYLATAAAHFANEGEREVDALIDRMAQRKGSLDAAFADQQKSPAAKALVGEQAKRAAATRRALGMPPEAAEPAADNELSYSSQLKELTGPKFLDARKSEILNLITPIHSPEKILTALETYRRENLRKPGIVWGVETPRIFAVQYGAADYRIPASLMASALFAGLCPLVIAWIGSFYFTRQRELLGIRDLQSFRDSFPHILNMFPVSFVKVNARLGVNQTRRAEHFERKFRGVVLCIFRFIVILLYIGPMLGGLAYASVKLTPVGLYESWASIVTIGGVFIVVAFLVLSILIQEAIVLYGKNFYD